MLAEALGRTGAISRARAIIDDALMRSERHEERWYVAEFLRVKGELLQLEETPKAAREAEKIFRRSIDCARQQGALSWELRTSISLARLNQAQGRIVDARNALVLVSDRFQEGFQTADLKAAKVLLETLS